MYNYIYIYVYLCDHTHHETHIMAILISVATFEATEITSGNTSRCYLLTQRSGGGAQTHSMVSTCNRALFSKPTRAHGSQVSKRLTVIFGQGNPTKMTIHSSERGEVCHGFVFFITNYRVTYSETSPWSSVAKSDCFWTSIIKYG